jgi:hypothetical protein
MPDNRFAMRNTLELVELSAEAMIFDRAFDLELATHQGSRTESHLFRNAQPVLPVFLPLRLL